MNTPEYELGYRSLIDELQRHPHVLAAILSGSRARGFSGKFADTDMYLVVTDEFGCDESERLKQRLWASYRERIAIDLGVHGILGLSSFRTYGCMASETAWDRYALVRAILEFDNSGGQVTRLFNTKQSLCDEECRIQVEQCFPGYLNYFYRSCKSIRNHDRLAAILDAAQSIQFLMGTLFALHHRVTPFNKFLKWELEHAPLSSISNAELFERLDQIVTNASLKDQIACFRVISKLAQEQGFGSFVEGWGGKLS